MFESIKNSKPKEAVAEELETRTDAQPADKRPNTNSTQLQDSQEVDRFETRPRSARLFSSDGWSYPQERTTTTQIAPGVYRTDVSYGPELWNNLSFKHTLEFDQNGKVVGGQWLERPAHPDFIWSKPKTTE